MSERAGSENLRAAVEELFAVFAPYPLPEPVQWCRCCISFEEEQRIVGTPLRELSPEAIGPFAENALGTCGGVRDFKHFLPRIFELLTDWPAIACEPEFLMERIVEAGRWRQFPAAERDAIERWLEASWRYTLHSTEWPQLHYVSRCGRWLCVLVKATGAARTWLDIWENEMAAARRPLIGFAEFINREQRSLLRGTLSGYYTSKEDPLLREVIEWIVSREHADRLDDFVMQNPGDPNAATCEAAATILRKAAPQ